MPVMMTIYGIHKPRYQSNEQVLRLAKKLELTGDIYRVKEFHKDNESSFKYLGNTMPDVLVFNSKGQLTTFELSCSGDLDSIINLTPMQIDQMLITDKTLNVFINDSYPISLKSKGTLDFTHKPVYVIKFAEYVGLLNKDNVPKLEHILKQREDVEYVLLNMDYTTD